MTEFTFYNYENEVAQHIRTCLFFDDFTEETRGCKTLEEVENKVRDCIWEKGEVTGRDSGFYTDYIAAQAYLAGNFGLLESAIMNLGKSSDWRKVIEDPAYGDVLIRCFVFDEAFIHVTSCHDVIDILKGYRDVSSANRKPSGNATRTKKVSETNKISSKKGKPVKRQNAVNRRPSNKFKGAR